MRLHQRGYTHQRGERKKRKNSNSFKKNSLRLDLSCWCLCVVTPSNPRPFVEKKVLEKMRDLVGVEKRGNFFLSSAQGKFLFEKDNFIAVSLRHIFILIFTCVVGNAKSSSVIGKVFVVS